MTTIGMRPGGAALCVPLVVAMAMATATATATATAEPRKRRGDDPHPHVATQRLVLALAAGTWPLADYVDGEAGLVYLDIEEGLGDTPRRGQARLLCGSAIAPRLAAVRRQLHAKLLGDHATGGLACHNRPGPPTCSAGGATEGDSLVRLEFRDDPARGLRLTAVIVADDEVHADGAWLRDEHAAQRRRVDALAAPGCPAPLTIARPPPPP